MLAAKDDESGSDFSARDFYAEVAEVLEETLAHQPQRQDLRLKLLEVYAASGRREAFNAEASEYQRKMEQGAGGDWTRVEDLSRSLLFKHSGGDAQHGGGQRPRRFGESDDDERLTRELTRLAEDYERIRSVAQFLHDVDEDVTEVSGRMPVTVYPARRLSEDNGGAAVFVAREDVHDATGRKLANAIGQAHVAKKRGCGGLVTGTVSGQHGVAVASACAHMDLHCTVHMRKADAERNESRVALIKRLGAELRLLKHSDHPDILESSRQFTGALNEVRQRALEQWLTHPDKIQLANGLAAGPEPFPSMLRDFHASNGRTVRRQIVLSTHALPDMVVAGLDGGLDAFNLFVPFLGYTSTRLIAVPTPSAKLIGYESKTNEDAESRKAYYSDEQIGAAERILRAQGFPSTEREHAWLRSTGRVNYLDQIPEGGAEAAELLARTEGLLVTAESGAALTVALREARQLRKDDSLVVMLKTGLDLVPDIKLADEEPAASRDNR